MAKGSTGWRESLSPRLRKAEQAGSERVPEVNESHSLLKGCAPVISLFSTGPYCLPAPVRTKPSTPGLWVYSGSNPNSFCFFLSRQELVEPSGVSSPVFPKNHRHSDHFVPLFTSLQGAGSKVFRKIVRTVLCAVSHPAYQGF